MAIISRELTLKYPDVFNYTSIKEDYIRKDTDSPFWLVNTNKLIGRVDGVNGLKTGYCSFSGYNITLHMTQNGMSLISVVFGYKDSKTRNSESLALLRYGFSNYELKTLIKKDTILETIDSPLYKYPINILTKDNISLLVKKNQNVDYSYDYEYCIDNNILHLPKDKNLNVQMEPEIALRCILEYENNKVINIKPVKFCAFNDASVRNDKTASKISQKKNFSTGSKGLGNEIEIDKFSTGGICDNYSLVSFLQSKDEFIRYGECAKLSGYSYFYQKLLEWIKDKLNTQQDYAVLENLSNILKDANYPKEMIITIGATRYEEAGKNRYLQPGDICYVVAFDHTKFNLDTITNAIKSGSQLPSDVSVLRQEVR